jgi:hypothetical protein
MTSALETVDMVAHPPHYNHGGIECIDAIRESLGLEGFSSYCRGAVVKYLWRCDYKGRKVEDLKKAAWYLNRLIEELEKGR